jgi:hypothetical protein
LFQRGPQEMLPRSNNPAPRKRGQFLHAEFCVMLWTSLVLNVLEDGKRSPLNPLSMTACDLVTSNQPL